MAYEYHPKDPRAKLREVVTKYLANMRVAGQRPNRGVAFDDTGLAVGTRHMSGWLVDDPRPVAGRGARYLMLEDGDVWRAVGNPSGELGGADQPGSSSALDAAVARWLAEPSDDLVTLLARSLADARMGGSGWLADGDGSVEVVADRRAGGSDHAGPERRRG
jgi:hypothetical protein